MHFRRSQGADGRRQNLRRSKWLIFDFYQKPKKMAEKKFGARKDEAAQFGPVDSHVDLLRLWVQLAGESDGPACAEAWLNVRRLAHALELRAARHHAATVRPGSHN